MAIYMANSSCFQGKQGLYLPEGNVFMGLPPVPLHRCTQSSTQILNADRMVSDQCTREEGPGAAHKQQLSSM